MFDAMEVWQSKGRVELDGPGERAIRSLGRNQRQRTVVVIELPKLMPGLGMVRMLTHLSFQQLARGPYVLRTELIRAEDSCLGPWQPLGKSSQRRVQRGEK